MARKDEKLTPNEKLMDTNNNGKVSDAERRRFREQAPETVAGKWGLSYALITQLEQSPDPEAQAMAQWFNGKAREYLSNPTGFSDRAFIEEFDAQPWAQRYKRAAIEDMDFEAQFPGLYKDALDADVETLRDEAAQIGAQFDEVELRELAKQRRRFGLNPSQMQNALADAAFAKDGRARGRAGQVQTNLREWVRRNGIQLSDNMINDYVRRIQAGDTTLDDVLQDLRRTYASGAYPAWADKINEGFDPADLFEPYRQTASNLLELPEIGLDDPVLKRASQAIGADGKPIQMPLYQFEQEIRKDPRWQQTNNAMEAYNRLADQVLSMFGLG